MHKSKLAGIVCALLLIAMIFTGCPDDGGGSDTDSNTSVVNVTGVTLKAGESTSGSSTIYVNSTQAHLPASVTFTVVVEPANATNKAVSWAVTPDTYVTWNETTKTVTAKAKGGPTKITVTTADGGKTAEWTITVADADDYVAVTAVTINETGPITFTKAIGATSFEPATSQLEWTVSPDEATDKSVTWSVAPAEGVVTVSHGLVTPVGVGNAVITLASVDNPDAKATINVSVTEEGTEPSGPTLKLYNQAAATGATTATMPEMDPTTKRYTINNANSEAAFQAGENNGNNGVINTTIVYFDKKVTTSTSSISARVRIKTMNAAAGSGTNGVIVGLLTDPTQSIVRFMGIRATTVGQWRRYNSRDNNTNTASALTAASGNGYGEASATPNNSTIDGVNIPFDEEMIMEYERTGTGTYTVRLKDYAGRDLGSSNGTGALNIAEGYLGFIIANAEVEISQITIKEGTESIFTSPASAPIPTPVASIAFTAPAVDPTATPGEYECGHSTQNGALTISAKVLPARATEADKTVNWNVVSGLATLSANTGDSVTATFSATGTVIVTATAGGKSIKLTIDVTAGSISVTGITISAAGNKTSITAGNGTVLPETLQFTEVITPPSATDPVVTWSLSSTSSFDSQTTLEGCIISNTGLLTAPASYTGADFTIYVFAKAVNNGGAATSDGKAITVKEYVPTPVTTAFTFSAAQTGWSYPNSDTTADADTKYTVGSLTIQVDGTFRYDSTRAAPTTGTKDPTSITYVPTAAIIQAGGTVRDNFLTIPSVKGPFTVIVAYEGTGSGQTDRYGKISVKSGTTTTQLGANGPLTNGTTNTQIMSRDYAGTDTVDVLIGFGQGALRIHDVVIIQ